MTDKQSKSKDFSRRDFLKGAGGAAAAAAGGLIAAPRLSRAANERKYEKCLQTVPSRKGTTGGGAGQEYFSRISLFDGYPQYIVFKPF